MDMPRPNYQELGFSTSMGPQLRALVEKQLLADLKVYSVDSGDLKFDWSDSCIEGHDTSFLDGQVENFSGIAIYESNQLIAEGWMDFVHEGPFFLAYWDYVTIWKNGKKVFDKRKLGIPSHVWEQIPDDIKWNYEKERL